MNPIVSSDPANDAIMLYPRGGPGPLLPERFAMPVGLVLSALIVVAVAGAFAAIASSGPSGHRASSAGPMSGPTVIDEAEAAVPAGGNAAPVILLPDMDYAQIAASLSTDPAELCAGLDKASFPTTPWQPSVVDAKTFECSAALDTNVIETTGEDASASSVFFIFRGANASRVTTLRLKLNLVNPGEDGEVLERTRLFLSKLQEYPDLALPQAVIDAVSMRRATSATGETATIRFYPDAGDARRFNLMVDYRPPGTRNRKVSAPTADSARWSAPGSNGVTNPLPQDTTVQTRMAQPPLFGRNGKSMLPAITPQFPAGYSR